MKPETEKRLAERLGFRLFATADGWMFRWNGHDIKRDATSGELALWQLCGELMEKDGWVKCSERLPEVGREVFVFTVYATLDIAALTKAGTWKRWSTRQYGSENLHDDITHWRPLPHPPEGE